jgi:hypothetical protein
MSAAVAEVAGWRSVGTHPVRRRRQRPAIPLRKDKVRRGDHFAALRLVAIRAACERRRRIAASTCFPVADFLLRGLLALRRPLLIGILRADRIAHLVFQRAPILCVVGDELLYDLVGHERRLFLTYRLTCRCSWYSCGRSSWSSSSAASNAPRLGRYQGQRPGCFRQLLRATNSAEARNRLPVSFFLLPLSLASRSRPEQIKRTVCCVSSATLSLCKTFSSTGREPVVHAEQCGRRSGRAR